MAKFRYLAIDPDGASERGVVDAESAYQATLELKERGYTVHQVDELGQPAGLPRVKPKLSWEELDFFNQQLHAIVKSELPLTPGLRALAQDVKSKRLREVLMRVQADVEAGASLSDALQKHPRSFSKAYLSAVRAGERAGNLAGVLEHLCQYSARSVETRNRLVQTLAYPAVVIAAACAFVFFFIYYILPVYAISLSAFNDTGVLDWKVLRFLQRATENPLPLFGIPLLLLAGAVLALKITSITDGGRYALNRFVMMLPFFGRRSRLSASARFARTLSLLLASKVPLLESLSLAGYASGNAVVERDITEIIKRVAQGSSLSAAIEGARGFTNTFKWAVSNAEARGDGLEEALSGIAEGYDRSVSSADAIVQTLTGPALIVIIGAVLLFFFITLYLPLINSMFISGDALSG